MNRVLYDLAARDDGVRFSPYCWRVRMALAHKGLKVHTVPWRFTEKERIAFAQSDRVPVLVDGDAVVTGSMEIADYLEQHYPHKPLFGSPQARAHIMFVRHWTETVLFPQILRQIAADLVLQLHPMDVEYFRRTREARLGMTLEAYSADREAQLPALHASLQPLRATVAGQAYIGGDNPSFADYVVFAAFQWARCGAGRSLLATDDPVSDWFERLLNMFDGLGADAPCAHPVPTRPASATQGA